MNVLQISGWGQILCGFALVVAFIACEREYGLRAYPEDSDSLKITVVDETAKLVSTQIESYNPGRIRIGTAEAVNDVFLVASAEIPGMIETVIRRLELKDDTLVEFDYDPDIKGTQGQRVAFPEKFKQDYDYGMGHIPICGLLYGPRNTVIALTTRGGAILDPLSIDAVQNATKAFRFPAAVSVCQAVWVPGTQRIYAISDGPPFGINSSKQLVYSVRLDLNNTKDVVLDADVYQFDLSTLIQGNQSRYHFSAMEVWRGHLWLVARESTWHTDRNPLKSGRKIARRLIAMPLNLDGHPVFSKAFTSILDDIEVSSDCIPHWDYRSAFMSYQRDNKDYLAVGGTSDIRTYELVWDNDAPHLTVVKEAGSMPSSKGKGLNSFYRLSSGRALVSSYCPSPSGEHHIMSFDLMSEDTPTLSSMLVLNRFACDSLKEGTGRRVKMALAGWRFLLVVGSSILDRKGLVTIEHEGLGCSEGIAAFDFNVVGLDVPNTTHPAKVGQKDGQFRLGQGDPRVEGGMITVSDALLIVDRSM